MKMESSWNAISWNDRRLHPCHSEGVRTGTFSGMNSPPSGVKVSNRLFSKSSWSPGR